MFEDVFCISKDDRYVLYLPLKGIVLETNARFVNLLYRARQGDKVAIAELGVNSGFIDMLFDSRKERARMRRARPLPPLAPQSVTLFLTNDCPLRCKYCYALGGELTPGKNILRMPFDVVTGVLDEVCRNVRQAGSRRLSVIFHGGGDVATAWNLLKDTMEYAHKITSPHKIKVTTAIGLAGILNPKQRRWIVENIDSATVSVDGVEDIQNLHRPLPNGRGSFMHVFETLKDFDRNGFQYGIRTTVTSKSVHRLEEIVQFFCEEFAARQIKIEPMFPQGRAIESDLKSPAARDFVTCFRKARKIAMRFGRNLSYSGARFGVLSNIFCEAAGNSCAVTPNAIITSCFEVLDLDDPLSSLFVYGHFDRNARKMVIDEERRKKLYGLTVQNKPFCSKCFCKYHCAGDCPAKSAREGGQLYPQAPDRCYINQELTKDQIFHTLKAATADTSLNAIVG